MKKIEKILKKYDGYLKLREASGDGIWYMSFREYLNSIKPDYYTKFIEHNLDKIMKLAQKQKQKKYNIINKELYELKEGDFITIKSPFDKGVNIGDNGDYIFVKDGVVYRKKQAWRPAPSGYPTALIASEYFTSKIKSHKVIRGGEIYLVFI